MQNFLTIMININKKKRVFFINDCQYINYKFFIFTVYRNDFLYFI